MLFYQRRTEGTNASPQLNCSLSITDVEEIKECEQKFQGAPLVSIDLMEVDSNASEEADEEEEEVDEEEEEVVHVITEVRARVVGSCGCGCYRFSSSGQDH